MVLKVIQEEDSCKLIEKGARYDILYNEYHIPIHLFDIEMQKFLKLSIDLMPVTDKIWHPLMGKIINENQFFSIKKNTKQKAGYLCEICKGQGIEQGKEWQVEMHEEWEIYPKSALQRLKTKIIYA